MTGWAEPGDQVAAPGRGFVDLAGDARLGELGTQHLADAGLAAGVGPRAGIDGRNTDEVLEQRHDFIVRGIGGGQQCREVGH